jgi:hypothetical protein
VLNLALMFMVLFFVYPLKFLFNVLLGDPRMRQHIVTAHGLERVILPEHKPIIFSIFGAGFTGVMIVFLLLYRHAYKQRVELGLNEFETFETQHSMRRLALATAIGSTYFVIAATELLPHRTPSEKRLVLIASIAVLLILLGLLGTMLRLRVQRKRVTKEWQAKQSAGSEPRDGG